MSNKNNLSEDVPCLELVTEDHVQGGATAKIKVIEYGDYQCPQCAKANEIIKVIQMQFGNQILFVFRHFPRIDVHPFAQHAAEAAEAANSQQKFWQMHNRLFNLRQVLDDASLVEHALALQLNINQFLQEMSEDIHINRIFQDIESGIISGVNSTPTFFINGLRFEGDWENSALLTAIKQELQSQV